MTSAPRSASNRAQYGPAIPCERSTTRVPAKADSANGRSSSVRCTRDDIRRYVEQQAAPLRRGASRRSSLSLDNTRTTLPTTNTSRKCCALHDSATAAASLVHLGTLCYNLECHGHNQ